MPPHAETILGLRGLRRCYGALEAVRDLSLEVFQGEVFGLLGPNGAGKTTTIRMICGLLRPDAGEISVNGVRLEERSREVRRGIGLCPQELIIWETLTCLEQLVFVGMQYDMEYRSARRRSLELLETLGLAGKTHRLAGTLSGGMKRRLNLALALIHDPGLLVLDEPQAGLDPQSRILVREYVGSLAPSKTVLLTTHEMDEADRMAHRIGIMDHGCLLVADTPGALKTTHAGGEVLELRIEEAAASPGSPGAPQPIRAHPPGVERFLEGLPPGFTRLESVPGTLRLAGPDLAGSLPHLVRGLQDAGVETRDITVRRPTLEDVFISLTGRGLRE